jgi:DNA-binding MarR family transcriptional regulator
MTWRLPGIFPLHSMNAMISNPDSLPVRIADLLDRLSILQRSRERSQSLEPTEWDALRFLGMANRYSRQPDAVVRYLGIAEGLVSKALTVLEGKRLIRPTAAAEDWRRIKFELTATGRAILAEDPLRDLRDAMSSLDRASQSALEHSLTELLADLQRRNDRRSFGVCQTCRFFRRRGAEGEPGGPHRCGLTQEALSDADGKLVCAEHEAAE